MRTLVLGLVLLLGATPLQANLLERPEMERFLERMQHQHGFAREQLEDLFRQVQLDPRVIERITRPAEALPWHRYRKIFVTDSRIRQGVAFWERHAEVLERARQRYGVPAEIITAIIGVETRYGRHRGGYPVITALTTLGLDYPRRSRFFLSELEDFLLLTREEGLDPLTVMGSYAGAMGLPQFIASSYRHYAVDFDGDGVRNLLDDPDDAIGSVANYLSRHGWRPGEAIAHAVSPRDEQRAARLAKDGYKPHLPAERLEEHGIPRPQDLPPTHPTALIHLQGEHGPEYWVVLPNFYAITRYNHSPLYALAVHQLAQAIAEHRRDTTLARQ